MSSVEKQKHIRLKLAFDDLFECKEYANILNTVNRGELGSRERTIYTALLMSFVVSYGRAVSRSNTQSSELDGEVSKYFKELVAKEVDLLSLEEKKIHKIVMDQRDGVFAHSDAKPRSLMAFKAPLSGVGYIGIDNTVGYELKDIKTIVTIVNKLLSSISAEVELIEEAHMDLLIE